MLKLIKNKRKEQKMTEKYEAGSEIFKQEQISDRVKKFQSRAALRLAELDSIKL